MRNFLLGALAGFLATGALLFALGAFRRGIDPGDAVATRSSSAPPVDDVAALRASLAAAEREYTELVANQLLEPPLAVGIPGAPSKSEIFKAAVKKLVSLLTGTRRALNDQWFSNSLECDAIQAEFAAEVAHLAAESGLRPVEVLLCPDFRWSLVDAFNQERAPLSAEKRAQLDATVAKARGEWDAYAAARDGMSPLEQMRALQGMEAAFEQSRDMMRLSDPFRLPWIAPDVHPCVTAYPPTFQSRDEAVAAMRDAWASDFGLDSTAAAALEPAVRDYMRLTEEYMTARRAQVTRRDADIPDWRLGELDAMIETQRWMEKNVALTDAQRKALRAWSKLYEYRIDPGAPAPGK